MTRYVVRRLLGAVPLVLGVATLVFVVVDLAPGDPASALLSPGMTREVAEQMRANFGLDEPVHVRYVKWLSAVARGDFGFSYSHGRPVSEVVLDLLPNTLLLTGGALAIAFLLGVAAGTLQAVRRGSPVDSGLSVVLLVFYSMPSFWLGLMLILTLGLYARNVWGWPIWFPASGMQSIDYAFLPWHGRLLDRLHHLVLPTLTLVLVLGAAVARYVRASVLEVIQQDYVRTARAKGLPERLVVRRHALRNALMPLLTLVGLAIPMLFTGAVFVEYVFSWPGMGKAMVDAIASRDYPLIMAGSFLFAVAVVAGNLVADVLYGIADPRIRYD